MVGDGNDAVKVYAGARVPGQRFDCYAVRFGRKRGVFMNWQDTQEQTTSYKGMSVCGAMSVNDAVHYVRCGRMPPSSSGGGGGSGNGGADAGGRSGGGRVGSSGSSNTAAAATAAATAAAAWTAAAPCQRRQL